jgi:hypothetical protein
MAFFGSLFGRKEPSVPSGEVWVDAPSFLGARLLMQFVPEDRPLLTDQELASLTTPFSPEMRTLAELWIVMYVTWLMRLLVSSKLDEDVSDEMMASVYGRIATNQDRLPGIESIADGIKYWFRELDDGVRDAIRHPIKIDGEELAAVHMLAIGFLTRDSSSPFLGDANLQFHSVDLELAGALEEAKNIAKPRIDELIANATKMPR